MTTAFGNFLSVCLQQLLKLIFTNEWSWFDSGDLLLIHCLRFLFQRALEGHMTELSGFAYEQIELMICFRGTLFAKCCVLASWTKQYRCGLGFRR